jgi:hypothetical protein
MNSPELMTIRGCFLVQEPVQTGKTHQEQTLSYLALNLLEVFDNKARTKNKNALTDVKKISRT